MKKALSMISAIAMCITCFTSCGAIIKDKTISVLLSSSYMQIAQSEYFKEKLASAHEGVTVELIPFISDTSSDGVAEKIRTEIMSGKGPDVIYLSAFDLGFLFPDMQKTMQAGAFVDLNKYMRDSVLTNDADYYTEAFTAGQYDTKQYILPMSFNFVSIAADTALLQEAQVGPDDSSMQMLQKLLGAYYEMDNTYISGDFPYKICAACAPPVMDYKNKKLKFTPAYENCIAVTNELIKLQKTLTDEGKADSKIVSHQSLTPHALCANSYPSQLIPCLASAKEKGTPIALTALTNEDGGVTAMVQSAAMVTAGSANKAKAAQFIEDVFSVDMQKIEQGSSYAYLGDTHTFSVRRDLYNYVFDNMLLHKTDTMPELRGEIHDILDKISSSQLDLFYSTESMIEGVFHNSTENFDATVKELEHEYRYYFEE